ncbi:translation initiation factor IF-2-like [Cervus elaphus]|uniref:translation initiation factor IF-2-like n=1 Tax=Cervus elaphus TaxID=9860 RepID=UPI001CC2E75D|nr:translation initiation factor IF-2-like [Cervus elaphus]
MQRARPRRARGPNTWLLAARVRRSPGPGARCGPERQRAWVPASASSGARVGDRGAPGRAAHPGRFGHSAPWGPSGAHHHQTGGPQAGAAHRSRGASQVPPWPPPGSVATGPSPPASGAGVGLVGRWGAGPEVRGGKLVLSLSRRSATSCAPPYHLPGC